MAVTKIQNLQWCSGKLCPNQLSVTLVLSTPCYQIEILLFVLFSLSPVFVFSFHNFCFFKIVCFSNFMNELFVFYFIIQESISANGRREKRT